jgi:hypothetical protein
VENTAKDCPLLNTGTFISRKKHCMGIYYFIPVQVMRERKSQYRASRSGGLRIAPAEHTGTTLPSHERIL